MCNGANVMWSWIIREIRTRISGRFQWEIREGMKF